MSKTPVSTLQEYMAKQTLGMPVYDLINQTNGTHLASFTYRVTCDKQSAQGTATSKKEAKHNAAREMLKLLPNCNNNIRQSPTSPSLSPQKIISLDSYYLPGSTDISHDNIFVNSVGKLIEHCRSYKLKTPEYTVVDISGPDHLKMFTIKCSIGSLSANGTANTKKQAKHEAAQNMYQILMTTTTSKTNMNLYQTAIDEAVSKMKNINILDLKMEESPIAISSERAKELFPKLHYRDTVKIVKNVDIKDYHESLKKSVNTENRMTAQKLLSISSDVTKEVVLNKTLKLLNLRLECKPLLQLHGKYIVRYTLDSTPVIADLGIGKTLAEAKEQATANLLNSIDLLLK